MLLPARLMLFSSASSVPEEKLRKLPMIRFNLVPANNTDRFSVVFFSQFTTQT
jgi:hypothetical protein